MQISKIRLIAYYLPQFHPIPENDYWWGKGFTEWTNVAKAKKLFPGHYQPRVPADLGFYDLRVPETRMAQADLAKEYGIEGFCYWHYWFSGKRLLERPLNEVLKLGEPEFPFCIAWANQTWSGIWHGNPDKILIKQEYLGEEDYKQHFYTILSAFQDDRYISIDGKKLFIVSHPNDLPDPIKFTDQWREMALKIGLKGLFIIGINFRDRNPEKYGFDAITDNPPIPTLINSHRSYKRIRMHKLLKSILPIPLIFRYKEFIDVAFPKKRISSNYYPCVLPNWDNTPRCGRNGIVIHGSTPQLYKKHLHDAIKIVEKRSLDHRIVFIKSWNEWAEGNYLEPDLLNGKSYLKVHKEDI